jgi:hypothetical protein
MSVETTFSKDPEQRAAWGIDWGEHLAPDEVITDSTWTIVAPPGYEGLVNESDTFSSDTTVCTIHLAGGIVGTTYRCTNMIETSLGARDRRSFLIHVENH